jgi:hypothetical protein
METDYRAVTVGDQLLEEVRHDLSSWIIDTGQFIREESLSSTSFA